MVILAKVVSNSTLIFSFFIFGKSICFFGLFIFHFDLTIKKFLKIGKSNYFEWVSYLKSLEAVATFKLGNRNLKNYLFLIIILIYLRRRSIKPPPNNQSYYSWYIIDIIISLDCISTYLKPIGETHLLISLSSLA